MPAAPALNADYTAPPAKCALLRVLYGLAVMLFMLLMRRRIARLVGLEHLPRQGPFVMVANHLSYMDDFLLAYAVRLYCGRKLYIPTHTKAFRGVLRAWLHLAGGAVEIDPADREASNAALRRLIADGRTVLIFPEGTRSDGTRLLPFRFGAFNLAHAMQVPVVPVALVDTHRVLPKGRLWPVAGARASAVILPPVLPGDVHARDPQAMRQRCLDLIAAQALPGRLDGATSATSATSATRATRAIITTDAAAQATADHLAGQAEAHVEALIERGPETIRPADLWPVFALGLLGRHSRPGCPAMQVQHFRAWGFWLLSAPAWQKPLLLARFHRLARQALQRDPTQPFVHYVLGQFHLRAPWAAGGRRQRALQALALAYGEAGRYGITPVRFAISYAEALARNGLADQARALLLQHFAGPGAPPPADARLARRAERAAALLSRLQPGAG